MAKLLGLVMWAVVVGGLVAAPLPPAVEKINKEGIAVAPQVTIQGSLNDKIPEGRHLLKLHKRHTYAIDIGSPELKTVLEIEDPDGKLLSIKPSQKTFKPSKDGTYCFRVSSPAGTSGKYLLGVRELPPGQALPPGVHEVGPGGLTIASALNNNDPVDKVRQQQLCKTYEVKMSAGKSYTIDMVSQQLDSYLRLEDPSGKQLAEDDDGGGFPNARIQFRPQQDAIYRIITTTFSRAVGNFTLTVKEQP
jgi:hypothetical protein